MYTQLPLSNSSRALQLHSVISFMLSAHPLLTSPFPPLLLCITHWVVSVLSVCTWKCITTSRMGVIYNLLWTITLNKSDSLFPSGYHFPRTSVEASWASFWYMLECLLVCSCTYLVHAVTVDVSTFGYGTIMSRNIILQSFSLTSSFCDFFPFLSSAIFSKSL